ncbi:MAG: hypothetical protein WBB65_07415 [Anaerolineales bacterium]
METFTEPRDFEYNPHFDEQRMQSLDSLDLSAIDAPVVDIVVDFVKLPYCFTLQICNGHFLYAGQTDRHNLDPLPPNREIQEVEYRIAYIVLCVEDTSQGRKLFKDLGRIPSIDREYIQFGSADWFWERQVNSYALQVEPKRFMFQDSAIVDYQEAQHIDIVRNDFFRELRKLLLERLGRKVSC